MAKITRRVYVVTVKKQLITEYQYLQPKEFHLIKTMLNDGLNIIGVAYEDVSPERYKFLFG